jgi:hypothetical protein
MRNPLVSFVVFVFAIVLRHNTNPEKVYNAVRRFILWVNLHADRLITRARQVLADLRADLAWGLYRLANHTAPQGIPVDFACPVTAEGSFGCVPCTPPPIPRGWASLGDTEPDINLDAEIAALFPPLESPITAPEPETIPEPTLTEKVAQEVTQVPHSRRVRTTSGKRRTDYKPVAEPVEGQLYWFKVGRRWQEMVYLKPDSPWVNAA